MTQTTNTQIDRIIKRTDEITEKELARQELPSPRTQTNTTQNKEELSKKLKDNMTNLVDELFPKGNKERGKATVLMAMCYILANKSILEAHQSGIEEERKRIETNIGFLRQWINEKPDNLLVTNEDIEEWLFNFEPLRGTR